MLSLVGMSNEVRIGCPGLKIIFCPVLLLVPIKKKRISQLFQLIQNMLWSWLNLFERNNGREKITLRLFTSRIGLLQSNLPAVLRDSSCLKLLSDVWGSRSPFNSCYSNENNEVSFQISYILERNMRQNFPCDKLFNFFFIWNLNFLFIWNQF